MKNEALIPKKEENTNELSKSEISNQIIKFKKDIKVSKYECEYCGKIFPTYGLIYAHRIRHENQRLYRCRYEGCSSTFNVLNGAAKHERSVHQG